MINWSRVRQLQDEVGADSFDEVIELFLEEVEAVIEKLKTLDDGAALGDALHFLKGSALTLGFDTFSLQCHNGEIAAGNGQEDTIDIVEILDSFTLSKEAFLSNYVAQLAA